MKNSISLLLLFFFFCSSLTCPTKPKEIILSPNLKIISLSASVYVHTSNLDTRSFGKVACNGMIYINGQEAYIFDTPTNNEQSNILLDWLQDSLELKVMGVVINHFHVDCLGGLEAFHRANIPSYSTFLTQELARKDSVIIPEHGFEKSLTLKSYNRKIICEWFGEAHTKDNIITWIPDEKTIFGGCMIKSINAKKGNLADANTEQWSSTIEKIKAKYGNAITVIPGHGQHGGVELLDYTIDLFK